MGPSQKIVWFSFRLRPSGNSPLQAPVVQMLDSAIHQINHFPADNYVGKQSHYPLEIYPPDSAINLLNNWGHVEPVRETISQTSLGHVYCWRAIDRVAFREIESHEIDFFEPQDRHSYFVCTLPRSKKLSGEYLSFIFSGLTSIFC